MIYSQDRVMLWFQDDGAGSPFVPFGLAEKGVGMTGASIPGAGRSPVYGRDTLGKPIVIKKNIEAPGDLPSATIQVYERGQIDVIHQAINKNCPINIQKRFSSCGILSNPNLWDVIDHFSGGDVTNLNFGDSPGVEFSGEAIQNEATISFNHIIRLLGTGLAALSSGVTDDLLDVTGIADEDCGACGNGYEAADKILFVAVAGDVGGTTEGNTLMSNNGGSSFTPSTSEPFAGTATDYEDVTFVQARLFNKTQIREIVGTGTTVAASKAQTAWTDVTLGDEATTAWTVSTIGGTSVGDIIEALDWLSFSRLFTASAGDIYLSIDQGESWSAALYTGATAFSGFSISPDGDTVWAYGASNLILREVGENGIFETRVGPTGGGTFGAITIAGDGTMYAGNGTSIFSNTDNANNANNWTELKDFGANNIVVDIQCIGGTKALGGDSQLLRAIVDDTTPGVGGVWESLDGGATWTQVTAVTNTGYNAAYFGKTDDNYATIVGDGGTVHRLAPR